MKERGRGCLRDGEGAFAHLFFNEKVLVLDMLRKALTGEMKPLTEALRYYWQLFQSL